MRAALGMLAITLMVITVGGVMGWCCGMHQAWLDRRCQRKLERIRAKEESEA